MNKTAKALEKIQGKAWKASGLKKRTFGREWVKVQLLMIQEIAESMDLREITGDALEDLEMTDILHAATCCKYLADHALYELEDRK